MVLAPVTPTMRIILLTASRDGMGAMIPISKTHIPRIMSDRPRLHRNIKVVFVNCFVRVKCKTRKEFVEQNTVPAMVKNKAKYTLTGPSTSSVVVLFGILVIMGSVEVEFSAIRKISGTFHPGVSEIPTSADWLSGSDPINSN